MILKNPAIDSLKLRIKADKVEFTPKGKKLLLDKKVLFDLDIVKKFLDEEVNPDDLEDEFENIVMGDFKRMAYIPKELEDEGIKLRFLVVSRNFPFNPELNGDYLEIQINSKLLKEKYFEGITLETVAIIWDEINSLGLFEVSYDDFVNGYVVDVDIKADIDGIDKKEFRRFLKLLNNLKEGELHIGKNNLGLQYGYRHKTNQVISKPFIKLYYKPIELINNSPIFYKLHLEPLYGSNAYKLKLARVEGTIKNKGHFRSLGIKDNSFLNVLEYLNGDRIVYILGEFLNRHLKVKKTEGVKNMLNGVEFLNNKLSDGLLFLLVKQYIKNGFTLEMVESNLRFTLMGIGLSKSSIWRAVKRAKEIYLYLLESDETLKVEKDFFEFLNLLNVKV